MKQNCRTLLLLGASLMQRPAIVEAKKLGCKVVAVDANPLALCVPMADHFEQIDLKDIDSLVSFAKKLENDGGLSGVFTCATDFSVSVATIAQTLSLPSHSLQACKNASDKALMRSIFAKNAIPSPKFIEISEPEKFDPASIQDFSHQLVIKPADNMGARGCQLVRKNEDILKAIKDAMPYSRTGRVIVEEFIQGPEFSIEGLVFDGKVHITALADRHIYFSPYFVEMGHTIPSNYPKEITDAIIKTFIEGTLALGLSHGACKGDIFFDTINSKAVIGEIAARLSGGYMSGWTVPYSSSINITRLALQLALGDSPDAIPAIPTKENTKCFCSERAYISAPGVVNEIVGLDATSNSCNVMEVFPRIKAGDVVKFPKNNVEKCGNVISTAPTYQDAILASKNALKNIVIRLEANNQETDNFFASFNDSASGQTTYPPNHFIFEDLKEGQLSNLIRNSSYIIEENLVYPSFFSPYLHLVSEPNVLSISESIKKAFEMNSTLKSTILFLIENKEKKEAVELLTKCFIFFVRGGVQGILYWEDSYKDEIQGIRESCKYKE